MAEPARGEGVAMLVGMSLASTEIRYLMTDPMSPESSFNYDIAVERLLETVNDIHTYSATLSIEKYAKPNSEDMVADFTATYLFGVRASGVSEGELEDIGRMFASSTVWSAFASLAALVTSQMNVVFPLLPPYPGNVKVRVAEAEADTVEEI